MTDASTLTFTSAAHGPIIAAWASTGSACWVARPDASGVLRWQRVWQRLPARHGQRAHRGRRC